MNSLRTKLSVLLATAIVIVVAIATVLFFYIVAPRPQRPENDRRQGEAQIIALVLKLLEDNKDPSNLPGLTKMEPDGIYDGPSSRELSAALEQHGFKNSVHVYRYEFGRAVANVKLEDGRYLAMPIPGGPPGPPNEFPFFLLGWLALVAIGTTGVVIVAVHRMTKPLEIIERTVAGIGPDGELPRLEEKGATEVRAAAIAINRLSDRLRTSMESRMRIVAAAAHDLRTPLTRMRLRAEFLEEDREKWLADLSELDRIADSAIRLVREEVESAGDEEINLHQMVQDLERELKQTDLPIELLRAEPVAVLGRPMALKRAMRNLMVNAATHGRAARVAVSMEGGKAVLVIEDDGPGIPDSLMARVFEPFFRVDPARQAAIPGAGLGLAIAHEIITRHGGRIILSNRPSGGLLQRMEMPSARVHPDAD